MALKVGHTEPQAPVAYDAGSVQRHSLQRQTHLDQGQWQSMEVKTYAGNVAEDKTSPG